MPSFRTARLLFGAGLLAGALALPGAAAAQAAPVSPMARSEPHERLSLFIGTWTMVEFPAEANFTETCDWLEAGRRHVICRSRWQSASGPRAGLSIFSYHSADSTYVYHGFRAGGGVQTLQGRVNSDGTMWEFTGDEGTGTARTRTWVRIVALEDGRFRFTEQTATGDGPWSAEEVVTYRRLAPEP